MYRAEYALGRVGSLSDATDAARLSVRDLGRFSLAIIDGEEEEGGGSPFRSGIMATGDAVRMGMGIIMATGDAVLSCMEGMEGMEDMEGIEHINISSSSPSWSSSWPGTRSSGPLDWEVTKVRDRRMAEGEAEVPPWLAPSARDTLRMTEGEIESGTMGEKACPGVDPRPPDDSVEEVEEPEPEGWEGRRRRKGEEEGEVAMEARLADSAALLTMGWEGDSTSTFSMVIRTGSIVISTTGEVSVVAVVVENRTVGRASQIKVEVEVVFFDRVIEEEEGMGDPICISSSSSERVLRTERGAKGVDIV